jgi:cation transport regulator ChaC
MTPRAIVSGYRQLFPTTHSDLRVTWHPEADTLVVTLWKDGRCTGSAPLTAADAGRLLAFLARQLAHRATAPVRHQEVTTDVVGAARDLAGAVRRQWRAHRRSRRLR